MLQNSIFQTFKAFITGLGQHNRYLSPFPFYSPTLFKQASQCPSMKLQTRETFQAVQVRLADAGAQAWYCFVCEPIAATANFKLFFLHFPNWHSTGWVYKKVSRLGKISLKTNIYCSVDECETKMPEQSLGTESFLSLIDSPPGD